MNTSVLRKLLLFFGLLAFYPLYASPWTSPPTTLTGPGVSSTDVSINAKGASVVAWIDSGGRVAAALRPAGINSVWSAGAQLSTPGKTIVSPVVAINANGDAIAIWQNFTDKTIEASFRPASTGTWSALVVISTAAGVSVDSQDVAISNDIVAGVWRHDAGATKRIETNTFNISTQTWEGTTFLSGDDASLPQISMNNSSDTVAMWQRTVSGTEVIEAQRRQFGFSWMDEAVFQLSSSTQASTNSAIGLDSAGNPLAVWSFQFDGTNHIIQSASWKGATWSSPVNLSGVLTAVNQVRLAVNEGATAAVVWSATAAGSSLNLVYAAFLNTHSARHWTPETLVSRNFIATEQPEVGVDSLGNAIIIWNELLTEESNEIIQSRFFLNSDSTRKASEIVAVSSNGQKAGEPTLSVGSGGSATVIWEVGTGGSLFEQAAYFAVSYPPLNVIAERKKDRFLGQTDLYNRLRGTNHPGNTPVTYSVYRVDGTTLIKIVSGSSKFRFDEHNRRKNVLETYQVVTNNSNGGESFPFTFSVSK